MDLNREELKFIIANVNNFMDITLIKSSNKIKFILIYLNTMVGRYETNSLYDFKKLNQKKVKNLTLLDTDLVEVFAELYDYVHIAFNSNNKLDCYVDNKHVASNIYEITHYLLFEKKYQLNSTSFLENLKLDENINEESIIALYRKLREAYDPIRNNMQLVWIRNQKDIKKYSDFKKIEIYHLENKISLI